MESRKYKITFNQPEYDAEYEFVLSKSGTFAYGNQTQVTIMKNGKFDCSIDTRYDHSVTKDFDKWCDSYLENMFNSEYEPQIKRI